MPIQRRILKPDQSYSFHRYFKMRFSIVSILAGILSVEAT
jgi:hypothetical protein